MRLTVRPITLWPGKLRTPSERAESPFKVSWSRTTIDLEREVEHLDKRGYGAVVVVEMAVQEVDIRLDGWIRADARPQHPGVILHVDSKSGPLKLWTDRFWHWDGNIRAISLYLQHQRAAERYGLGTGTEAFQGWKAIGAQSIELGPAPAMTYEQAVQIVADASGKSVDAVARHPNACFRTAAAVMHPDTPTGSEEKFKLLVAARDLIMKVQAE